MQVPASSSHLSAFWKLSKSLDESRAKLQERQLTISPKSDKLGKAIEKFVEHVQSVRLACLDADEGNVSQRKVNAFLLSRKTDATRQVSEARRFLDEITSNDGKFIESQPLDFESEQRRRQLAADLMNARLQMILQERRSSVLEQHQASPDAGVMSVLQEVMKFYDDCKNFDQSVGRLERKLSRRPLLFLEPTCG